MSEIIYLIVGIVIGHFFGAKLWSFVTAIAGKLWVKVKGKLPSFPST